MKIVPCFRLNHYYYIPQEYTIDADELTEIFDWLNKNCWMDYDFRSRMFNFTQVKPEIELAFRLRWVSEE